VVTLMTLHTAKGLEFPVVFLTGMEDGVFPPLRAMSNPKALEEERRLAYVGITRARQRLYLCRATMRSSWGARQGNRPARCGGQAPATRMEREREGPPGAGAALSQAASRPGARAAGGRPGPSLSRGDKVTDDAFGLGPVVSVYDK